MFTISVCSLKGGVGKSTIALSIADALHRDGHRTLLVDADGQGSCLTWSARAAELDRNSPPVVGVQGAALARDVARLGAAYDAVIIDGPPRMAREARAAMIAADIVVIPLVPGGFDAWAAHETIAVLDDARQLRPELHAGVVLNRCDRTVFAREARAALGALGVDVLNATIGSRVAFGRATLEGQGVCSYDPEGDAAREVRRLVRAILALHHSKEAAA